MRMRWIAMLLLTAMCGGATTAVPVRGAEPGVATPARAEAHAGGTPMTLWVETSKPPGPLATPTTSEPGARVPCDPSASQREAYDAPGSKTVLEAQLCRTVSTVSVVLADGRHGTATLVDLAPTIHVWFLLTLALDDGTDQTWHLENPAGQATYVRLDPRGLSLTGAGDASTCELWTRTPTGLEEAAASGIVYGPLCDGALAVRNPTSGQKTMLERTTDFLRDHVWGGEAITTGVKVVVVSRQGRSTAELGEPATVAHAATGPSPAAVDPDAAGRLLPTMGLALPVDGDLDGRLVVGSWNPVLGAPGVWASIVQPRYVHPDVMARNAPYTNPLDSVESAAFVYSVAFDLGDFDLGYDLGTDHPRADWSDRVPESVRDPSRRGPDGYDRIDPLVRTGLLNPVYLPDEVSLFVGGFKRSHGGFSEGDLAMANQGSHYGFVVFGTEISHLQPGLATVLVDADGTVDLRTWTEADAGSLSHVRHARQNGVALLEPDPETGEVRAGDLVKSWSAGNWSGSVDRELRSMRGAVCLQDTPSGRYLIYSVFATATPSAMADVFAAYDCSYAMMLDMNALEHTYLSVTTVEDDEVRVHHLVKGMEVLDKPRNGATYPRFVGYADNRDFFYLLRKHAALP